MGIMHLIGMAELWEGGTFVEQMQSLENSAARLQHVSSNHIRTEIFSRPDNLAKFGQMCMQKAYPWHQGSHHLPIFKSLIQSMKELGFPKRICIINSLTLAKLSVSPNLFLGNS